MAYTRAIPASVIDKVEYRTGDYEAEMSYHETVGLNDPDYGKGGRTWISPQHEDADKPGPEGKPAPLMLHYAVNRPVGCVRGESDLQPILIWLNRYQCWLGDRVEINAVARAFVWICTVATGKVAEVAEKYVHPPQPGSVLIVPEGSETWSTLSPDLHATDAASDGKAIRWMIAAGSPGMGLIDFGEADEANLASAKAMAEQRRRFMSARQAYFGNLLANTVLVAYNRAVRLGLWRGKEKTLSDIDINYPDIASEDNKELGTAAFQTAQALALVQAAGFSGNVFKKLFLRAVLEILGQRVEDADVDTMLKESGALEGEIPGGKTTEPNTTMAPLQPNELSALNAVAYEFAKAAVYLSATLNGGNGHG
jgi:hypothetical protein